MKCREIKEILLQIKKYEVTGRFNSEKELYNWIMSLNQKQIDNFLSIPNEIIDSIYRAPYLYEAMFNVDLLNSNSYLKDLTYLKRACEYSSKLIYKLATNPDSLSSQYHDSDMELIFNIQNKWKIDDTKSRIKAIYKLVTYSGNMELILNIQNILLQDKNIRDKLEALYKLIVNSNSLTSQCDDSDRELIFDLKNISLYNIDEPNMLEILYKLATNPDSLSSQYHTHDMLLILSNRKNNYLANILITVARNKNSLSSEYHVSDMELILNEKKDINIKVLLAAMATNPDSLESGHHIDDMQLILDQPEENLYLIGLGQKINSVLSAAMFDAIPYYEMPYFPGPSLYPDPLSRKMEKLLLNFAPMFIKNGQEDKQNKLCKKISPFHVDRELNIYFLKLAWIPKTNVENNSRKINMALQQLDKMNEQDDITIDDLKELTKELVK